MTQTKVLYNGACPICSTEVEGYKRSAEKRGLPIVFQDLNAADLAVWGVDADQAARRFHVAKNGEILDGLPAFAALWEDLPNLRWLARLMRLPVIRPLGAVVYDRVLAPALYALHRRRIARRTRAERA